MSLLIQPFCFLNKNFVWSIIYNFKYKHRYFRKKKGFYDKWIKFGTYFYMLKYTTEKFLKDPWNF